MDSCKSAINAQDAIILFADLQAGIVELTTTNPLDRLRRAVLALGKLAKNLNLACLQNREAAPVSMLSERDLLPSTRRKEGYANSPHNTANEGIRSKPF
jgi:hypothetical protein